jgi:hypothetical protein
VHWVFDAFAEDDMASPISSKYWWCSACITIAEDLFHNGLNLSCVGLGIKTACPNKSGSKTAEISGFQQFIESY